MTTITLNIREFFNFRVLIKDNYTWGVDQGNIVLSCNTEKLVKFGYL